MVFSQRNRASREGGEPPRAVAAKHRALSRRDMGGARHGVRSARAAWRAPRSRGAGGTRRRALRGPGAPAGGRGRTETPLQNSQRVLLAKPTEHYPRVVRPAARWSAAGTPGSRPTAITPRIMHAKFARVGHVHCPGDAMVARGGSPPLRRDNRLPGLPAPYRTPCRAKRTQRNTKTITMKG